jgi:bifunctional non-homologous end joining protein LigD
MGLQRYQAKRHFDRTPEPRGSVPPRARRAERLKFVVQRHAASTLHYDFRLEMDGVLKSWAVTKEPAEDSAVKRLAVRTEDHPLEYADFEGDIPEREYGAGHVDLWDQGAWVPDEPPLTAVRRGKLTFELKGRRMKGRWALIRMGNASTRKKDLWLLMKVREGDGDARR